MVEINCTDKTVLLKEDDRGIENSLKKKVGGKKKFVNQPRVRWVVQRLFYSLEFPCDYLFLVILDCSMDIVVLSSRPDDLIMTFFSDTPPFLSLNIGLQA